MPKSNHLFDCSFCGRDCKDDPGTRFGFAFSDTPDGIPIRMTVSCRDCYIKEKLPGWEKVAAGAPE